MNRIEIKSITKTYNKGEVLALKGISFDVAEGELFGLIGPDGAGKTTLFRILTTLLLPDSGTAKVADYDIISDFKNIRNVIGYMPGRFSLYQDLTVEENLSFFATLFNTSIEENYHLIKDIYEHIEPFKERRAGNLSGGMKQKLALCCALIHRPKVLFLDEPTTGIDPVSRVELWDMLQKVKKEGISILVSTPYMDEAVRCDRIALIQKGKILNIDKPINVTKNFDETLLEIKANDTYKLLKALKQYDKVKISYAFGEYVHAIINDDAENINLFLQKQDIGNVLINKIEPNVEDIFIYKTVIENLNYE